MPREQPSTAALTFTKCYADPIRAGAAVVHHTWLDHLGAATPRLLNASAGRLDYEHITGRHARPEDIPTVAAVLGHLHGTARRTALRAARMNRPAPLDSDHVIAEFAAIRVATIRRRLAAGCVPAPRLDSAQAERLLSAAAESPVAFYKDSNIRNVLITSSGPVLVDFDDLTLAPFGYDLGKLLITTAMTYGTLLPHLIESAVAAYNRAAARQVPNAGCDLPDLANWIEIHHILTSPYLGRHGYGHSWHTLRPW